MAGLADVRTALDGLRVSVDALTARLAATTDPAVIQALLDQIATLQAQVDGLAP